MTGCAGGPPCDRRGLSTHFGGLAEVSKLRDRPATGSGTDRQRQDRPAHQARRHLLAVANRVVRAEDAGHTLARQAGSDWLHHARGFDCEPTANHCDGARAEPCGALCDLCSLGRRLNGGDTERHLLSAVGHAGCAVEPRQYHRAHDFLGRPTVWRGARGIIAEFRDVRTAFLIMAGAVALSAIAGWLSPLRDRQRRFSG